MNKLARLAASLQRAASCSGAAAQPQVRGWGHCPSTGGVWRQLGFGWDLWLEGTELRSLPSAGRPGGPAGRPARSHVRGKHC